MSTRLLIIYLSVLPFFFWPLSPTPHEVPKVILFQISLVLSILLFLINIKNTKLNNLNNKIIIPLGFFLVTILITSYFGKDFTKSLFGNYWRNDGLLSLFSLCGFTFLIGLSWQEKYFPPLTKSLSLSSLLLSLLALFQAFKYLSLQRGEEILTRGVDANFGNSIFLGGYLLVTLPFTWQFIKGKKRSLSFFLMCLHISGIVLSASSGAILGIGIFTVLLLLLSVKSVTKNNFKRRDLSKLKAGLVLLVLTITISLALVFWLNKPTFTPHRSQPLENPESRERIWSSAITSFEQEPLTGWGWANFDYAIRSIPREEIYKDVYIDKAHSHLLEVMVSSGVFGITSYLVLIVVTLWILFKKSKDTKYQTLLVSFLLFLFHSQTNVISINEEIIFWLIVGIVASDTLISSSQPRL